MARARPSTQYIEIKANPDNSRAWTAMGPKKTYERHLKLYGESLYYLLENTISAKDNSTCYYLKCDRRLIPQSLMLAANAALSNYEKDGSTADAGRQAIQFLKDRLTLLAKNFSAHMKADDQELKYKFVIIKTADGLELRLLSTGYHYYLGKDKSVVAAGEANMKEGKIEEVNDSSGCYCYDTETLKQTSDEEKIQERHSILKAMQIVGLPLDKFKPEIKHSGLFTVKPDFDFKPTDYPQPPPIKFEALPPITADFLRNQLLHQLPSWNLNEAQQGLIRNWMQEMMLTDEPPSPFVAGEQSPYSSGRTLGEFASTSPSASPVLAARSLGSGSSSSSSSSAKTILPPQTTSSSSSSSSTARAVSSMQPPPPRRPPAIKIPGPTTTSEKVERSPTVTPTSEMSDKSPARQQRTLRDVGSTISRLSRPRLAVNPPPAPRKAAAPTPAPDKAAVPTATPTPTKAASSEADALEGLLTKRGQTPGKKRQ